MEEHQIPRFKFWSQILAVLNSGIHSKTSFSVSSHQKQQISKQSFLLPQKKIFSDSGAKSIEHYNFPL